MKNAVDEKTELSTPGEYIGHCRRLFNILEQWDGEKWRAIPHVVDRRSSRPRPINFDVEDALHTEPDPAERVFRPR